MKVKHKIWSTWNYNKDAFFVKGCVLKNRNTTPLGQQTNTLHYHEYYYVDDDGNNGWHNGEIHQKYKVQKAKIREELLLVAWHPSRCWDWCMAEKEKEETEKLWR